MQEASRASWKPISDFPPLPAYSDGAYAHAPAAQPPSYGRGAAINGSKPAGGTGPGQPLGAGGGSGGSTSNAGRTSKANIAAIVGGVVGGLVAVVAVRVFVQRWRAGQARSCLCIKMFVSLTYQRCAPKRLSHRTDLHIVLF
jgi:hypothetical protein